LRVTLSACKRCARCERWSRGRTLIGLRQSLVGDIHVAIILRGFLLVSLAATVGRAGYVSVYLFWCAVFLMIRSTSNLPARMACCQLRGNSLVTLHMSSQIAVFKLSCMWQKKFYARCRCWLRADTMGYLDNNLCRSGGP